MDTTTPKSLTIKDAAAFTGKSQKAIRSAVDRGSLPHIKVDGVRRIPVAALDRATSPAPAGQGQPQGQPREAVALDQLIERLEELATENGRLTALTEVAESVEERLKEQLVELQAEKLSLELRLAEAEAATSGRWFRRKARRAQGQIAA